MTKGTFSAVTFSLVIHAVLLCVLLMTQVKQDKVHKPPAEPTAIKSFLYYAPNLTKAEKHVVDEVSLEKATRSKVNHANQQKISHDNSSEKNIASVAEHMIDKTVKTDTEKPTPQEAAVDSTQVDERLKAVITNLPSEPVPAPLNKKIDSFTQLQRLRSQLNKAPNISLDGQNQGMGTPSVFNPNPKVVPHSVPVKDEIKARDQNTKNMGSGIAITKGDDGVCEIRQDMSVYGLTEGSSTQYFSCGESKFAKSFREHMQQVNAKLSKK